MPPAWRPTRIDFVVQEPRDTSTAPFVVATDVGDAYVKAMGNPQGPTALACDLLGTRLAEWLGLPILDMVVHELPREFDQPLKDGCRAQPGPALLTRAVVGHPWRGTPEELNDVSNPEAFAGLVVLDTWLRNIDRCCPRVSRRNIGNVFLVGGEDGRPMIVLAMDQTDCIRRGSELTERQLWIAAEKDEELLGLFPEFIPFVTRERAGPFADRLTTFPKRVACEIVRETPTEWISSSRIREALPDFCASRARLVGSRILDWLADACSWQPTVTSS